MYLEDFSRWISTRGLEMAASSHRQAKPIEFENLLAKSSNAMKHILEIQMQLLHFADRSSLSSYRGGLSTLGCLDLCYFELVLALEISLASFVSRPWSRVLHDRQQHFVRLIRSGKTIFACVPFLGWNIEDQSAASDLVHIGTQGEWDGLMRICFGRKRKTLRSSFCMTYTLKTLEELSMLSNLSYLFRLPLGYELSKAKVRTWYAGEGDEFMSASN